MSVPVLKRAFFSAAALCAALLPVRASRASSELQIDGVKDRWRVGGERVYELYGVFGNATDKQWLHIRPEVICNGSRMSSRVDYVAERQINVFFDEPAPWSSCTVQLERITDGARSNSFGVVPRSYPEPYFVISSVNDRQYYGGRRWVELYGSFLTPPDLEPHVQCDGRTVAAKREYTSSTQVNLSWLDDGYPVVPLSRCSFVLRAKGSGLETPMFGAVPDIGRPALPGVGAYHWGGVSRSGPGSTLPLGQGLLASAGFATVARFTVEPKHRNTGLTEDIYRFRNMGARCAPPWYDGAGYYLPCALRQQEYRDAFAAPELKTIVLTAYDASSLGPWGWDSDYLDPVKLTYDELLRARVRAEYEEAAFQLLADHAATNKTFIFGNWETDNAIYCGSAWNYSQGPRNDECPNRPSIPPSAALAGLKKWFELRKQGIARARARAQAMSPPSNAVVKDAIEFNSVRFLQQAGLASTLDDLIPQVQPDVALYSSYDSQYSGTYEEDLRWLRGVGQARKLPIGTNLVIGETGFERHGVELIDIFRTVESAKAIQRAGVPFVLWVGFDTSAGAGCVPNADGMTQCVRPYGVVEADGADRLVTKMLRAALTAQAAEIANPPSDRIDAVTVAGVAGGFRYFELWGAFDAYATYSPVVVCDGADAEPAPVIWRSSTQINIKIPHDATRDRYCVFQVVRHSGSAQLPSLSFGPKLVPK